MLEPYKETANGCEFWMLPVEGGQFDMGDEQGDLSEVCHPVHRVTLPNFYLGKYLVTQALWKAVMGSENPSRFQGDELPVELLSWKDITEEFLPALRHLSRLHYRLPTEAEWEYAARGGKYQAEGYKYAGSDRLKDVGWFDENSGGTPKNVGLKSPNQLGLYDMSGNLWEWCEDDWHSSYDYAPEDGSAWINRPERDVNRVGRGGTWIDVEQHCRAASRTSGQSYERYGNVGFRLALSPQENGHPYRLSDEQNLNKKYAQTAQRNRQRL